MQLALDTNRGPDSSFTDWFAKLHALESLQRGWDSYSAAPPSVQAMAGAEGYLNVLRCSGPAPTRIEASAVGGVGITHRQDKRKVYVEFYNDGTVHALFSDGTPGMFTCPVEPTPDAYAVLAAKARGYLDG